MDETEAIRRALLPQVNQLPDDQIEGQTWTTRELEAEFEVIGFAAPLVVVKKRATGELGSLMFKHMPRVYFGWVAD